MVSITSKPIKRRRMTFGIRGTSPLLMGRYETKTPRPAAICKLCGGRVRVPLDPAKDAEARTWKTASGDYGIPAEVFKSSLVAAAHKDGIAKTLVRRALFFVTDDPGRVLPIVCDKYSIQENRVVVFPELSPARAAIIAHSARLRKDCACDV